MRKNLILTASIIAAGISQLSAQLNSTPCGAGPLPNNCSENTIVLTASDPNSGITDPSAENGVGCNSIGSDITAGTLGNSGGAQDYDVWYTTTVDVNGEVSVYAAGSDPVVGIYTGPCGSPTLVTCDDDGGTSLDALATANVLVDTLTVTNNLIVAGNTAIFAVDNVQFESKIITVNADGQTLPSAEGSGFVISGANLRLTYGQLTDALTVYKNITVRGNILPSISGVYNLGSPTQKWLSLYLVHKPYILEMLL